MQTLSILALASTYLLAPLPQETRFHWNPSSGTLLRRSISIESQSEMGDSILTVGDKDQDVGTGMGRSRTSSIEVLDLFEDQSAEQPTSLTRSYESLKESSEAQGAPEDVQVSTSDGKPSLLEGQSVDYVRESESDDWSASWADGSEGPKEWLGDLRADMDLAAILPSEPVAKGDSWEVDLEAAHDLIWPGGSSFPSIPEAADVPEGGFAIRISDGQGVRRLDELEGSLIATFVGTRQEDDRSLGIIQIELSLEGSLDVTEDYARDIEARTGVPQAFDSAQLHRSYEGKGELAFDLEAKHLHSLKFTTEFTHETDSAWTAVSDTFELDLAHVANSEGETRVSIEVEKEQAE